MLKKKKMAIGIFAGLTLAAVGAGAAGFVFYLNSVDNRQVKPVAIKYNSVDLDFSNLPKTLLNKKFWVEYGVKSNENQNNLGQSFTYTETNKSLTLTYLQPDTNYYYNIFEYPEFKQVMNSTFKTSAPLTINVSPKLGASSNVIALSIDNYSQFAQQTLTIKATPVSPTSKNADGEIETKKEVSQQWQVPLSTSNDSTNYFIKGLSPDTEYLIQIFDKNNTSDSTEENKNEQNKDGAPLLNKELLIKTDKEFGYEVISSGLGETVIKFSGLGNLRMPDSGDTPFGNPEPNTSIKVKITNLDDENSSSNSFEESLSLVNKFEGGDSFKNTATIALRNETSSTEDKSKKITLGNRYSMELKSEGGRIKILESSNIINFNSGGSRTNLFNTFDSRNSRIDKTSQYALINLKDIRESDWTKLMKFAKSQYAAGGSQLISEDKDAAAFDYSVSRSTEIAQNVSQSVFFNIVSNIENLIVSALSSEGLNYDISKLKGIMFGIEDVQRISTTTGSGSNTKIEFNRTNNPILGLYPSADVSGKSFLNTNGTLKKDKLKEAIVDMITNNFKDEAPAENSDSSDQSGNAEVSQ